jgi:diguanylate cyclase (GGDEF)-like protein
MRPSATVGAGLRAPSPRHLLYALAACLVAFSTGIPGRPPGPGWAAVYDLVLYNAVYVLGAVLCWQAARRVPRERLAWRALAVAQLTNVLGNVVYTLVVARMEVEPYPSVADYLYLAAYPALYVAIIGLIRCRVTRFHTSMWLDGIVGGLGAAAVAIAVLLGPSLQITGGDPAAVAVNLAFPVADVLLLALLVAVSAMLGLRSERTLLLLAAGLVSYLVGDIVFLDLIARDVYVEGGVLDLTWLVGVAVMGLAAHLARSNAGGPAPRTAEHTSRVSWRVLAVPLLCNAASLLLLGVGWGDRFPAVAAWCAIGCVVAGLARTVATLNEVRSFHEAREQARTDELTGLPNRRALLERTTATLADTGPGRPAALLLLDLDGFKEVNDSLGHHAGDDLLRQVGPRLRQATRGGDVLARLGGDEFALLLPDTDLLTAERTANDVHRLLREPFAVSGIRLHIGASIGVASALLPTMTVSELLRHADAGMYTAKTSGEGVHVHVHVPDEVDGSFDRLRTMEELRTAIDTDQLVVHLQPQVALDGGRVVGVEALVRWHHPTRGMVMPADLLPAAAQAGLLQPLADTVLALSLDAAATWWRSARVPVSVNLSAANVTDLDLPDKVEAALLRAGLPADALVLELVEDTLMTSPQRAHDVLSQLRALGVRTSIDDYGTGYSSLAYLHHLPADELKLDRSLTADLDVNPRAAAIVRHTVALAHDLGLRLVAEGVEHPGTAALLAELGCDVAQGWAVARPMPVEDFVRWLGDHATGFRFAEADAALSS